MDRREQEFENRLRGFGPVWDRVEHKRPPQRPGVPPPPPPPPAYAPPPPPPPRPGPGRRPCCRRRRPGRR